MAIQKILPGTGGDLYIPYSRRTGDASTVYFTRDLSAEGLRRIDRRVNSVITGKNCSQASHRREEWPQHHSSRLGRDTH